MSDSVVVPGSRDVRGRLDTPEADRVVVACPPHPQYGGTRSDPRLRAVSEALAPDVACLRFDYGETRPQGGSRDVRAARAASSRDAENAISWAADRFERVGLFGYSFGAGVALRAAADTDSLGACSVLAPPGEEAVLDALDALSCPLQVVYGERDDTVAWEPVVERARDRNAAVESLPADHHFAGQFERVGALVATFLRHQL